MIDHTLLKPEATDADVTALIAEAIKLGTYSVCVSPSMLPLTIPAGADLKIAVVCGFPSGEHHSSIKAAWHADQVIHQGSSRDRVPRVGAMTTVLAMQSDVSTEISAYMRAAPVPVSMP
jgi:deoxyribose-phosphate aldolase